MGFVPRSCKHGDWMLFILFSIIKASGTDSCGMWISGALSAVAFAALLLGEEMTAVQIIGAACIIGGAMTGELVKSRKTQ